ncbi:hypothetical protein KY284_017014 [Solanum tuberosum]|nr:hypothetical protein KY284_017014 [Solanum tuberosum]
MRRATTKTKALDGRQPIMLFLMGVELIICRMRKFCPRQLHVGSVSRRRGIILPRLIPFEAEDSMYVARRGGGLEFQVRRHYRAIPATRSKGQILASPGIKFSVDSMPAACRALGE